MSKNSDQQQFCDDIYQQVVNGETDVNEALYAFACLARYAEDMGDTAAYELFNGMHDKLISESDETDEDEDEILESETENNEH